VLSVEMRGIGPTVANEELRAASIGASMRHRQHAAIVVLIASLKSISRYLD
jgi:hypothetical protein